MVASNASLAAGRRPAGSRRPRLRCLAIVPAYNEEASIAAVVGDVRRIGDPDVHVDVLVVDDGSTDRTAAVAAAAGARVVSLPFNLGVGAAVQTGYLAALRGGYDVAVQVDGDGQHPAGQLPRLARALEQRGADLVVGSRFVERTEYQASRARSAGMGILSHVVSAAVRARVTDTTSGFRAAGPRAIRLFAASYPHDYPEVEAIVVANRAGLTVVEEPVEMRHRQGGRSSITPVRSVYYMVKVLLAIMMELLRRRSDRSLLDTP
jgi:glycosyltransferase involved in cell wall biosynthesis